MSLGPTKEASHSVFVLFPLDLPREPPDPDQFYKVGRANKVSSQFIGPYRSSDLIDIIMTEAGEMHSKRRMAKNW